MSRELERQIEQVEHGEEISQIIAGKRQLWIYSGPETVLNLIPQMRETMIPHLRNLLATDEFKNDKHYKHWNRADMKRYIKELEKLLKEFEGYTGA
ncbi:MAG: hypothetical protein WCW16_02590 [Candidatus Magasanikbacteria bacterium]